MDRIRILYFVDSLGVGGIQTILLNWIENLPTSRYEIDVLTLDYTTENNIEEKLKSRGIRITKLTGITLNNPFNFILYWRKLNDYFQNNFYNVVHIHSSSKNYLVLKAAKKYRVPIRIVHAHSTNFVTKSPIKKIIGDVLKRELRKYSTDFLACSYEAGKWLYGEKIVNSSSFMVINNAINYEEFKFNPMVRNEIRDKYNIGEKDIVIGHVGRMAKVKNHEFLLDVFLEYRSINQNCKLILVGDGELMDSIKEKAAKNNLNNDILFLGNRDDVANLMQAMDLFLMPSLYEGLPMVLIEAQASGLTCLISDTISHSSKITESVYFESLNFSPAEWAKVISNMTFERRDNYNELKKNEFLISNVIEKLENIYRR